MKKNGFIATSLLYGVLTIFLVLILSTLGIFSNRKLSMDKLKENALDLVESSTSSSKTTTILSSPVINITDTSTTSVTVTIIYPDGCSSYTCNYTINSSSPVSVTTDSISVTVSSSYFTDGEAHIYATITDNTSTNIKQSGQLLTLAS